MNSRRKFIKDIGFVSLGTIITADFNLSAKSISYSGSVTLPGGFATCAGMSENGWYAASLVLNNDDKHSISDTEMGSDISFRKKGEMLKEWTGKHPSDHKARLVLSSSWQDHKTEEIACEDVILFPVSPAGMTNSPVVVFVSRNEGSWFLNLYRDGENKKIFSSQHSIRYPSVISIKNDIVVSFEQKNGEIFLINSNGQGLYQTKGKRAKILNAGDRIALMKEICTPNGITTHVELINNGSREKVWDLPAEDDYTFNGDICCHHDELFVVSETTHAFGQDDRMGNYRKLRAWSSQLNDNKFKPLAEESLIPVPEVTSTWMKENLSPIRPRIFIEKDIPVVIYRRFRDAGFKKFGWDLYKISLVGGAWTPVSRITENIISPDTGYGFLQQNDSYIMALPSFDDNGSRIDKGPVVPENHRIEVMVQDSGVSFPDLTWRRFQKI